MYVCRNDRNVCIYIRIYILWISFLDERVSKSGFARFDAEHYGTCFEIFWFQMLRWPQNGSRQRMKRKLHFGVRSQISVACHRIFPLVKCYTSSFLLSHKIEAILLVLLSVGLHLARSTEPKSAGTSSLGYKPNITQSSIFPQNW